MQWIKSLFQSKAPASSKAVTLPAPFEIEVPRYPPFMKGLPVVEPEKLLASQSEILAQYKRTVIVDTDQYEKHYMGALQRFASYVHLLPASQSHHHRGAGGLLRHSMEVGLWALQGADKMLLNVGKTPAQRRSIEPRWQLTAFLAGLCHDVGKPATDITITSSDRNLTWRPLTEDLYVWAKQNRISSYFLDWRPGRGKQHIALSNLIAERIIGTESLQWIEEGGTDLVVWLMEALNGSPGATNPLYDLVIRADQTSVERDLKTMGVAMAGYELGVPVERHLTDIMRRLIKEGIWQINEPNARVWNINGGIYLVWPAAGEEIARKVREDGVPGFPRTHDGILDMLRERGLAFVRESEGERFWRIAPAVLEAKIPNISLACIRLRDDTLISSVPIPVVPGKLRNGEEEGEAEAGAQAVASVDADSAIQGASEAVESPAAPPAAQAQASAEAVAQAPRSAPAEPAQAQPQAPAATVKAAPAKFKVDSDTGEIIGVEPGDPDAKKKPALRQLPTNETSPAKQGISKPMGLKIKQGARDPANGGADPAAPHDVAALASTDAAADADVPKKKPRKKRDYKTAPELKFSGSVGELFLALADDLVQGVKKWGVDVRVDAEEMVLLRWPASFANYGLSGKNILDECTKQGWIWVDQDMPFVRLVDAEFQGEPCKALRLMPEPGDALLYHAKYNPDLHRNPVVPKPEPAKLAQEQTKPEAPLPLADGMAEWPPAENAAPVLDQPPAPAVAATKGKANQVPKDAQQKPQSKPAGKDPRPPKTNAPALKAEDPPQPMPSDQSKPALPDVAPVPVSNPAPAPLADTPGESSAEATVKDGRIDSLIKLLDACPVTKEHQGWRYVDRNAVRAAAIAAGVAKDRKDLNVLIESNAKRLQVTGALLRYQPAP